MSSSDLRNFLNCIEREEKNIQEKREKYLKKIVTQI